MSGTPVYRHHEQGRRLDTTLVLALFLGLIAFCHVQDAPWWMYLPLVIGALGLAWMVLFNPTSGSLMDHHQLRLYSGSWSQTIRLSDIESVRIIDWSDGSPSASIKLRDGSEVFVHSTCFRGELEFSQAFRSVGIATE